MRLHDTVAAISTPPGHGGIGVVRISGPQAIAIAGQILEIRKPLQPRTATLARLPDEHGELIDETIVTSFQSPGSFTGEDVVEISCHGSPVILQYCLSRAVLAGARLAEPGEFTLRAFVNGRIDLPRAEAIRELIESTTLHQARIAARQTQGSVSKQLGPIKTQLLELISLLEAGIDFAEDDISVAPTEEILRRLDPIIEQTAGFAATFAYGKLVREGFSMAIVGPPNAGKSSLFNRLLRQNRAIVTATPGTTRDLVSETAELDGIPVRMVDTAGIRETSETIERMGIEKTFEAIADADLTLVVLDGSQRTQAEEKLINKVQNQGRYLVAINKADLPGYFCPPGFYSVSAVSGYGIERLRQEIRRLVTPGDAIDFNGGIVTSVRHLGLLQETASMLRKAREAASEAIPHELLLLDLYCALRPLDEITGATTADDILNRIFSSFCIGK